MVLGPTLTPRLSQRQAMTQEMQQSVKILAMSGSELHDYLKSEQDDYPLLDVRFPTPSAVGFDLDTLAETQTFHGALLAQIGLLRIDASQAKAALAIIGDLDPDGMLRGDLSAIAERSGQTLGTVVAALEQVQSLEPAGVAARNAAERWALQLRARQLWSEDFSRLIKALRDGVQDPNKLANTLGLPQKSVVNMMQTLLELPSDLSTDFAHIAPAQRTAEVRVLRTPDGVLRAELNVEAFPTVQIAEGTRTQAGTDFERSNINRAHWLQRALQKRAQTVLKIMNALIELQPDYFASPSGALVPLTQKELAAHLSLAPSTITRSVRGKAFEFEGRPVPLSQMFSSAVVQSDGELVSGALIRARINALVANEPADGIYSDNKIKQLLEKDGITVARRTIAKYRESMDIPKASLRRIRKRLSRRD